MRKMEILNEKLKTFLTTPGKNFQRKMSKKTPPITSQMSACYSISFNTNITQMNFMASFISLLQKEKTLLNQGGEEQVVGTIHIIIFS